MRADVLRTRLHALPPWLNPLRGGPGWIPLSAGLGLLLVLPSVQTGWSTDDHFHRSFVLQHLEGQPDSHWWDLFDSTGYADPHSVRAHVFNGRLPWWTSPRLSLAAFRPLSAATHYLDYVLWPSSPAAMHIHNLLWLGVLIALVGVLYRRLLGPAWLSALALLMFAVDEAHAEAVCWIAGRNTLLTAVFVAAALLALDRQRRENWRGGFVGVPLLLLLGLASSEGALGFWGFGLSYALFVDRGPVRDRVLPLLAPCAITVAWLLAYRTAGYGMRGSGLYLDPIGDPGYFLTMLPERLFEYFREQLALPESSIVLLPPALRRGADMGNVAFLAAVGLCVAVAAWKRPHIRFWAAATLGAMLPVSAAGLSPRLLLIPSIAAFGLVAELVRWAWEARSSEGPALRGLTTVIAAASLLIHVPLAAARAPQLALAAGAWEQAIDAAASSFAGDLALEGKRVYVLNTPNLFLTELAPMYTAAPEAFYIVGAHTGKVELSRPRADTLVLRPEGGYLLETWSRMYRSPSEPFEPGYRVGLGWLSLYVDQVTADGRPARIRLVIPQAGDPRLSWLIWNGRTQRYESLELPEVGERKVLLGQVEGGR